MQRAVNNSRSQLNNKENELVLLRAQLTERDRTIDIVSHRLNEQFALLKNQDKSIKSLELLNDKLTKQTTENDELISRLTQENEIKRKMYIDLKRSFDDLLREGSASFRPRNANRNAPPSTSRSSKGRGYSFVPGQSNSGPSSTSARNNVRGSRRKNNVPPATERRDGSYSHRPHPSTARNNVRGASGNVPQSGPRSSTDPPRPSRSQSSGAGPSRNAGSSRNNNARRPFARARAMPGGLNLWSLLKESIGTMGPYKTNAWRVLSGVSNASKQDNDFRAVVQDLFVANSNKTLRKAFLKSTLKVHPNKVNRPTASNNFAKLSDAHIILQRQFPVNA
jgi:hypothetical protein